MIDPRLTFALADRYRLEREIGSGGMATVYLAQDLRHQRSVAVKVLRPELSATLEHERFLREITTTAGLRHPNILPLYDSGEGAGFLFYVMPFVEGENLRDVLSRDGPLAIDDALRFADEIANALSYAHGRGVIHRDIKPENILIENGHAIVADFGIAQAVGASADEKLTVAGMAVGTPTYMSPEQASGDVIDARSDLYALGCMVYEMLAGTPPFSGPTAIAVMMRHAIEPVPKLGTRRAAVSRPVVEAVERALAKSPADRFASVEEWRRALARARGSHPTGSAPPARPQISRPAPTPANALLGRDSALAQATERIRAGARVLTVTGTGGAGKTRFAIELFTQLRDDYADGSAFVSIASVTAASEVMPTIATALGIAEAHGRSAVDAVATVIGTGRILVLLDNLEHVLDAAGEIADLVSRCANVCVLSTSRAPLKIGAESELALPPLALPDAHTTTAEELLQSPAVALFAQRAAKVQPTFAITSTNGAAVASICIRLDGLPLALELAAARIRILEPAALLKRLDDALDLLTSGDRDLPERQRTLRATIDWSYSLLDAAEQRLLRRLSVFSEGWALEELEAVCYSKGERVHALAALSSLVEKGLVRVVEAGARYFLLETIRSFATEALLASGEAADVQRAHARVFLTSAESINAGIMGAGQLDAMQRARVDHANMHAAIRWFTEQARAGSTSAAWRASGDVDADADAAECGLALCGALNWFWHISGLHFTARDAIDGLLPLALERPPSRGRAMALLARGMVSINIGETERAFDEWARGLADARTLADDALMAEACAYVGYGHMSVGRMEESGVALDEAMAYSEKRDLDFLLALSMSMKGLQQFLIGLADAGFGLVTQARTIQTRIGDFEGGGLALSFLAQMTAAKGEYGRALELYGQALMSFKRVGDRPELARVHSEIGWTALSAQRIPVAREAFRRSLRVYDEVGSPRGIGLALTGLAAAEAAEGRAERAVTIAAAAEAMSERTGVVVEHPMGPEMGGQVESARATIGKELLEALVAAGRAMSPGDVLTMIAG
ncbi:protein kinase domain-containing protein [Gemmatimonas sp.]|uniref:protein kinase domain-containing protein n=1 Tax=Gemmatimonas sp. TaxID=1962908 RepID=UPI00398383C6